MTERVMLLRINKDNDPVRLLKEVYRSILIEYYAGGREDFRISMNNDDWLWLLDYWASFYLDSRAEIKKPKLSLLQRILIRLGMIKKHENHKTLSISTEILKQFRNEMSDGKYLFVNGYKIPVEIER